MSIPSNDYLSGLDIDAPAGSMLQYQQKLLRMSSNQGISNIQEAFVAVRLGQQNWLVELSEVQEALAPPRMARIGSSPSWIAGVVGVRGQVWSVIDMSALSPDADQVHMAGKARGWMTLLREKEGADVQGDRLALLWSDMVEVGTKQDYHSVQSIDDLVYPVSGDHETMEKSKARIRNEYLALVGLPLEVSGEVQTNESEEDHSEGQTVSHVKVGVGKMPPWVRAIWQDSKGQLWRELDTQQILGPQGLVPSWRQRVEIPAEAEPSSVRSPSQAKT